MPFIYPDGPSEVPAQLTNPTAAYTRHALLASLVVALFLLVYAAFAAWLMWKGYALAILPFINGQLAMMTALAGICAIFLSLFMLKALVFIERGKAPDLIEVNKEEQPALFQFLKRLADEAAAPMPHRVFVSPRVNAAVFYDLSILNLLLPSRKNLEIGLALVNVLTIAEFKAVLAHEYGHFAQRSMAVGRWVYIAQQIAAHIVSKRDKLDGFLQGLSRTDFRIAWIGWVLSIIVWSIRSLVDTVFRIVVLANRALSREMEFQADLVAVSLTGSDALINALYRLGPADEAWSRTLDFANREIVKKRTPKDFFAIQTAIMSHLRHMLGQPQFGIAPAAPADVTPGAHRLFNRGFAEPSKMWATHPHNHEREDNAKRIYLPAPLPVESAWSVFAGVDTLKTAVSKNMLAATTEERIFCETDETLNALDQEFQREHLQPKYHGIFLNRSPVRHVRSVDALYGNLNCSLSIIAALAIFDSLYPATLAEQILCRQALLEESAMLKSIEEGTAQASNKTLTFRGRDLKKSDVSKAISEVQQELAAINMRIESHDKNCRTTCRLLARHVGHGWEDYLVGLLSVIHYIEHSAADLSDAHQAFAITVAQETVGVKTSKDGFKRVMAAASKFFAPLQLFFDQRNDLRLDAPLLKKLGMESWAANLGEFGLLAPSNENINPWLAAADNWANFAVRQSNLLRQCALDELLLAEALVAAMARVANSAAIATSNPAAITDAPTASTVPASITTLLPGQERDVSKRRSWWEKFQLADGLFPTIARAVVAAGIVGAVVSVGATIGSIDLAIYNGLSRPVIVSVNAQSVNIGALNHALLAVEPDQPMLIIAKTNDGTMIESFTEKASGGRLPPIYNVAAAAPLVEWTASYTSSNNKSNAPTEYPPRQLGALRWTTTRADVIFQEPPSSVSGSKYTSGSTRLVLQGYGQIPPFAATQMVADTAQAAAMVAAHLRWDNTNSANIVDWVVAAKQSLEPATFDKLFAVRLKEAPTDVVFLRLEQDLASAEKLAQVCARHTGMAFAADSVTNNNGDLAYVAARCAKESRTRDDAVLALAVKFPKNLWIAHSAAYTEAGRKNWAAAAEGLERVRIGLPSMAASNTVELARIRRMISGEFTNISNLIPQSSMLRALTEAESKTPSAEPIVKALQALTDGNLDQALNLARADKGAYSRFAKLAATSEGATADMKKNAFALVVDEHGGDISVVYLLALAKREKNEIMQKLLIEQVTQIFNQDAESVLKFLAAVEKGASTSATTANSAASVDTLLEGVSATTRGYAYAAAVVLHGDSAPKEWREGAKRLLFALERPYFK